MKRKKMEQVELFSAPAAVKAVARDLTPQAERLLANFEVLAEAPGGVKKLRELVLELAVTGKLANSVNANKGQSVRSGLKVGDFVSIQNGYAFKSQWFIPEGVRLARNVNIGHGALRWEETVCISPSLSVQYDRYALRAGDILISLDRPIIATGVKIAKVREDDLPSLLLQRVGRVLFKAGDLVDDFFYAWLRSPCFVRAIDPGRSKGVPHISSKEIEAIPFCPPPVRNQIDNLAVLDQLMKLCDELEARQAKERETGARLTRSALDALANADGPEELAASWQRVVGNFEGLISRAEDVKKVREVVLELAVRGRLLRSESTEAPLPLAVVSTKVPFALPSNWRWATPEDLCAPERYSLSIGPFGSNLIKSDYTSSGVPLVFVREITSRQFGGPKTKYVSEEKAKELQAHFVFPGDLLITKMGTPPGDTAIYPSNRPPAVITADCIRFAPNSKLASSAFLQVAIESLAIRAQIIDITMGIAHQKVSLTRFRTIFIPLPPLPEQKRIVAKVDQLMQLCDELESKLRQAEETSRKVAEALVAELLA